MTDYLNLLMTQIIIYMAAFLAVWLLSYGLYLLLSRGLSASARHQQLMRYMICALFAVAPMAAAQVAPVPGALLAAGALAMAWMLTWPVLDFVTRRGHAPEIDNKMDFAFGMHMFGALSALWLLCCSAGVPETVAGVLTAVAGVPLLLILMSQWIYFAVYRGCVDHDGLNLALNSYGSEIREFFRSVPRWGVAATAVFCAAVITGWFAWNLRPAPAVRHSVITAVVEGVLLLTILTVTLKGRSASWWRTGIVSLWRDDIEYVRRNREYAGGAAERLRTLGSVTAREGTGRTFVLVIGESASREYMSAFTPQPGGLDDTPWLSRMRDSDRDGITVLFNNAYSCHFQTVPTLTHALTAANQTNGLVFGQAPSVVDLAHALGMKVYWYSNQSRVGFNDTPVSLMAEGADDFSWTRLTAEGIAYDGALLDFLPRVRRDPEHDTLLVLHLKGSHFNYESRYPSEAARYRPESGKKGYEAHYRNSLFYTDSVLEKVYDYCRRHLGLAAFVYCSDHADIPTSRRSPVFNGVERLRIPMQVTLAPDYAAANPGLLADLRAMRDRLWVNDFLYDVVAAVLDPADFAVPAPLAHPCSLLGKLPLE